MTGTINTDRIDLRINPTHRRADRRIRSLSPEQFAAYIELLEEATLLNAKTGSDYVDGDFSQERVLKWAQYITPETLDALIDAELVEQIDGDRYRIDFYGQTSHYELQVNAERNAERSATARANYAARKAEQQETEQSISHRRAQGAERSRQYRQRKAEPPEFNDDFDLSREPTYATTGYSNDEPDWGN